MPPHTYPKVGFLKVIRHIWHALAPQKYVLFLMMVGLLVWQVIGTVVIPLYYKEFFDVLTSAPDARAAVPLLVGVVVTIAWFNAARWFARRVSEFTLSSIEANGMARMRQAAFEYLIRHSHNFFVNNFSGSLVQRVSRFARSLERLIDLLAFNFIPLITTVVAAVAVTWATEPLLAQIILGWIAVFFVCNYVFSLWRLKYNIQVAAADSKTTGTLADIISNQNSVLLFAGFASEDARVKEVTADQARITQFTWNLGNIFDAVQSGLIFLAEFLIFYWAITLWSEGEITVGTFVLVQVYIIALGAQLWDFGRIIRSTYEIYADCKEMVEILALPHEIKDIPTAEPLTTLAGGITFENVSFSFNETRRVLDGINLTIPGGQKLALVGPSGAGKTTIVRILMRLYEVSDGTVSVDGTDIKTVTLDSLHRAIAFVPQDPALFHRTLRENIRYGRPDATDEEVVEAAHRAHCDEFIRELPQGYDTLVGERGVKLSGGERQRVAIARALLKNAPILVLDEATSSLDSESESLIQEALDELMKGKTVIVIAHRLSTIRKMDRIIVFDAGRIVEDGTHDELLKNPKSIYKHLWDLQAGGFIVEEDE